MRGPARHSSAVVGLLWVLALGTSAEGSPPPLFRLPLDADTSGHFFVDDDRRVGWCRDWQGDEGDTDDAACNTSNNTYDQHTGTDFSGGRSNPIRAAAAGWIIDKEDGNPDGCYCCTPQKGNFVRLYHGNGLSTVYLHMLDGTVTTKEFYKRVDCGEIIGGVGTSGCSTNNHLHFEPQTGVVVSSPPVAKGQFFNPFKGSGSPTPQSWWVNQGSGSPSTQCATNSWQFANGECVQTNSAVNVRPSAGGPCSGDCPQMPPGSVGSIIESDPVGALLEGKFYVWWKVRWADGLEGWSIEGPLDTTSCGNGPNVPTGLQQSLPIGGTTTINSMSFTGTVSSPQGKSVRLDLEIRLVSEPFTGEGTHSSAPVNSGGTVTKCVQSLPDGSYHWRARTIDQNDQKSDWISFGGNSESAVDFKVQANSCGSCGPSGSVTASSSLVAGSCGNPELSATLSANPGSGQAPLNNVDLTASASGTATGTINYTFYCKRSDAGTDITPGPAAKFDGVTTNPMTALDVCDYSVPGTYTAKVIVERGAAAAEHRTTIVVGAPSSQAPTVATNSASSVTQESASLNLTVNPNGSATDIWFDWDSDTSFCCSTPHRGIGAGTTSSLASMTLDGLACDTTYYFRARAQNAIGSASPGQTLSFKTDLCGGGGSETSNIVRNGGFLDDDSFWVRSGSFYADDRFDNYHDGPGYAYLSNSDGSPGNNLFGTIYQQVSIPTDATSAILSFWTRISTSEPSGGPAEDFLNATLQDSGGNFRGSLSIYSNQNASGSYVKREFNLVNFIGETVRIHFLGTTNNDGQPTVFRIDDVRLDVIRPIASAPTVTTESADQVTATAARLNMTVDANGATTTVWFDLEAGDSTPDDDTEHIVVGSGSESEPASISAFDLQCGTLYYFRARASNSEGSDSGSVRSFTTSACAGGPEADTDPAIDITQTSATLTADVNPNGLATQSWFAWGSTAGLGQETPHVSVGSEVGFVDFSQTLSGLTCGTVYYFENRASNSAGQDDGATLEFMTAACDQPSQSDALLLFASRQACAGPEPAVLLGWSMPEGADPLVTIRRSDGQYVATVNTAVKGPVHEIDSGLIFGNVYRFTVEAQFDGATLVSNELAVPISSDECRPTVVEGDLPHRPILWVERPFCESGVAKVRLFWTEAAGAQSYSLQRIGLYMPSVTYDGISGRSFVDSGLTPGGGAVYEVRAHNSGGSVSSWNVGVLVPGTVCSTSGAPGSFSASTENLVCADGEGSVTLRWGQSAGAAADYRTFEFSDHLLWRSSDNQEDFVEALDHLDLGTVARAVVQAESATTPGKFREAYPVAKRIPIDICGAGTAPPSVGGASASYIRTDQAFLRVSIIPRGSETSAFFEWGTSTAYGSATPSRAMGSGYGFVSLGEILTGLSCGTTYHFRGVAVSARGRTDGVDQSFTTPACAVPVVSISATDATATENPMTSGTFLIQRTGSTAASLAVTYTVGGTATVGVDHTLASGSVTIPAGSASQTLTVFPLDDSLVESTETVVVTLQPQGQYVVGSPSSATVTITSDEVPSGGGCGRILVDQPRDSIGGCDASDTGLQGRIAENFRLTDRREVSCLEVLGYYWPGNNPPQSSVFDVVFHQVASNGTPGAVVREDRGVQAQRQKTGNMTGDMEEWRFTIELTSPVELAAGSYFVEVAGAAGTGGSFCWSEGQLDPVAGLGGLAFRNSGQWSLGNWDLAFKVFERSVSKPSDFYTLLPCRVVDTRLSQSPLLSGTVRSFQLADLCGISATAEAVAVNVTAINATQAGYLTLFPADQAKPGTSTINFQSGQVRANNAILPLSADGRIAVFPGLPAAGQVDLVIDVTGYFDAGNSEPPTFAPKFDKPTGTEPLGLAVTDLDGDHRADIAVSIYDHGNGERLSILRNTGTAGHPDFDIPVDIPTGRGPEGVAAGDLNNDGKADLVTANAGHQTVTVFKNSSTPGTIAFELVLPLLGIVGTPHRVVIADFDGDGRPDLIVTSNSGRLVSVFHHASDPNTIAFDYRRDYGVADYLNDLAVADIDRNTKPEILIPRTDSGLLTIFQNSSSPGDVQAGALPPLAAGTAPVRGIAAGDLNNDLAVDVVVAAIGGVGVFQNSSSPGVFNLLRTDLSTGTNPDAVAIGDLNNDGLLDVAVANPSAHTVTVLHNTSEGSPIALTPLDPTLATGLTPLSLVLGDVDGDGWLDMIVANHEGNSVSVILNTSGQQ